MRNLHLHRKPSFNWNAQDRYIELLNFKIKVMNIPKTKTYELTDEEKVPVTKNWLGMEGLQLIKTCTNEEKEKCKTAKGLFSIISHRSKPFHYRIMLLLHHCKWKRKSHESAQEWMVRLWTKTTDCNYNEYDRRLARLFIHGLDDEGLISKLLREVLALENIDEPTSEWVLLWAQMLESWRAQKEAPDNIKEVKDSDSIRWNIQRCDSVRHMKQKHLESCNNCGIGYPQRQYHAYGKTCGRCSKTHLFRAVHKSIERQKQGQNLTMSGRSVHRVRQDKECYQWEQENMAKALTH